jgi:hypothetical protein
LFAIIYTYQVKRWIEEKKELDKSLNKHKI